MANWDLNEKIWGQNTMFDPQVNFWGSFDPWPPSSCTTVLMRAKVSKKWIGSAVLGRRRYNFQPPHQPQQCQLQKK